MGELQSRLGKRDLSLPNDKGQHLFITQVSVGLRAKLKQLPYHHPQRPERKKRVGEVKRGESSKEISEVCCYITLLLQHPQRFDFLTEENKNCYVNCFVPFFKKNYVFSERIKKNKYS